MCHVLTVNYKDWILFPSHRLHKLILLLQMAPSQVPETDGQHPENRRPHRCDSQRPGLRPDKRVCRQNPAQNFVSSCPGVRLQRQSSATPGKAYQSKTGRLYQLRAYTATGD